MVDCRSPLPRNLFWVCGQPSCAPNAMGCKHPKKRHQALDNALGLGTFPTNFGKMLANLPQQPKPKKGGEKRGWPINRHTSFIQCTELEWLGGATVKIHDAWNDPYNIQKRAHPIRLGTKAFEKTRLLALHKSISGVTYTGIIFFSLRAILFFSSIFLR